MRVECIGLDNLPLVKAGDEVEELIHSALAAKGIALQDGDVLIVSEKFVSKAEGRVIPIETMVPSARAKRLAKKTGKDPRVVELILRESKEVLALGENFLIVETKHGLVMANAGIDQSNIEDGKIKLLPIDPEKSAERIREYLEKKSAKRLGVVIADSTGRPFRSGSVGIAIGASGVKALWDRRGEADIYGRKLQVTRVAVGDSLATMGNLIMGEAAEKIPVVLIRGLDVMGKGRAKDLQREKEKDVFRC